MLIKNLKKWSISKTNKNKNHKNKKKNHKNKNKNHKL